MSPILAAARFNLILAPVGLLLAVFSSVLIARLFGPELYADYATLTSFLAWVLLASEAGCNSGLGRYMPELGDCKAQGSLYFALQKRRWLLSIFISSFLLFFGPLWAGYVGLPSDQWGPFTFLIIGLLSTVTLHCQLANFALLSSFKHARALLISQTMMIVRAVVLVLVASILKNPIQLISSLLVLASLEALIMHFAARALFAEQTSPLPPGLATKAQIHGFVSQYDKIATSLSGGALLLLVLAGSHERSSLAMLAISTELLQKLLSLSGLPLSNIILPVLNNTRNDFERYKHHVSVLGGLAILLFSLAAGAIATGVIFGLPLLFGRDYSPAVNLALIWLGPLFIESCLRMVWGAALLTLDDRKWLMKYNTLFGILSVAIIGLFYRFDITVLLSLLGILRVFMSFLLIVRANKARLISYSEIPVRAIIISLLSAAMGVLIQFILPSNNLLVLTASGFLVYCIALLISFYFLRLVPLHAYDALLQIAGSHNNLITSLIKPPLKSR